MSGSAAATSEGLGAQDRARRVGASVVRWVRQNPPGGRWHTWMFTAEDATDAIGPRADDLHLSPGSPTEYRVLEAVVRRTSGIRSTGRGLALALPASLRTDARGGRGPRLLPRHSGADPVAGAVAVLAVVVQLEDPDAHAVVVDRDDHPDHPHDPASAAGPVVFPAPDLVPAFLQRAVLGTERARTPEPPAAAHLRVQGWVATVIHASLEHGSTSRAVEVALDAAPDAADVRTTSLQDVHELVVAGELPGLPADLARWCGPELGARVVAGVYGRLPAMLRYADDHWPALGAQLGRRTRELLQDAAPASSPGG